MAVAAAACNSDKSKAPAASTPGPHEGSGAPAPVRPAAKLDPAQLDAALQARSITAADVARRGGSTTSAWAVAISKRNRSGEKIEYAVIRIRASDTAELRLAVPPSDPASQDIASLEVRDLDGDGIDEAILVVHWGRDTLEPAKGCNNCGAMTTEGVDQLYVVGGTGGSLTTRFTHVVSYDTSSAAYPDERAAPHPEPERVAYDWKVASGKPAMVTLTRTANQVTKRPRLQGVLDPATDPLFSAGAGKSIALTLP